MPSGPIRMGKEWPLLVAVLLAVYLLATASPPAAVSPGSGESTRFEDYGRMISLEEAPPLPAFLFRVLTIVFLTLFLSGLAINLQGLVRRDWRVFSPGSAPSVPWGVGPVVKLAIYFIALFLLLLRLEKILLGLCGISPRAIEPALMLGNAVLQFALLLGLALAFRHRYRREPEAPCFPDAGGATAPPASLPLPPGRELRKRVRQAFRGYICFFPLLVVLILLAWGITRIFDLPWQSHPLVQPLLEKGPPQLIWPLLLVGVILGPLAEELFFRGLLFPPLAKWIGGTRAAAMTAALFATLHFNWVGWIPIFGLGFLLARAYQRTGSLLVPILIHGLHNALFLMFTILVYQVT